jgi:hypothetical protein
MTRLTPAQGNELCRIGGIPDASCDRFVRAVEACTAAHYNSHDCKSPLAVEEELALIGKRAWRALRLVDRKTWRPGEFQTTLEDISLRLRNLSPAAIEHLQFRNLNIRHDIPSTWPDNADSSALIDPVCFTSRDDQILALRDLWGAVSAAVSPKRGAGRPHKDLELILFYSIAAAYSRETGKAASDSSTKFMALCSEIKRIYKLENWNPESLARSARSEDAQAIGAT